MARTSKRLLSYNVLILYQILFNYGFSQEYWTLRNPCVPRQPSLMAVTYGNGLYVAVGENGTIKSSPDGRTWTSRTSGTRVTLREVTFGDSIFATVGDSGTILISRDGIAWERKNVGTNMMLSSVAIGNRMLLTSAGVFSIAGGGWSMITDSVVGNTFGFLNERFIAVGGAVNGRIFASTDGRSWDSVYSPPAMTTFKRAHATTTGFVAVYEMTIPMPAGGSNLSRFFTYSSDGRAWKAVAAPNYFANTATIADSMIMCGGTDGTIFTTTDGTTWTPQISGTTQSLNDIIWHDSLFVAVGSYGIILSSPDGNTWTNQTGILNTEHYQPISNIAASSSSWVVVGKGFILRSSDLSAWECVNDTNWDYSAIAWNGERYVAIGTYSYWSLRPVFQMILFRSAYSSDGIVWTGQSSSGTFFPSALVWGGAQFIAVGEQGIAISPDGINWKLPPASVQKFSDVAVGPYNGSAYAVVAVGDNGKIMFSADGGNLWRSATSGTTASLNAVCYGNNLFVALREGYHLLISYDATTWTSMQINTTNYLADITWGAGTFVAVGNKGTILTSPDALRWTLRTSGTVHDLKQVIWNNGFFVAVGDSGIILSSPAPATARRATHAGKSGTSLEVSGHQIQYTLDTPGIARLLLHDLHGRVLATLDSKYRTDGVHYAILPNTLSNGNYFLSLQAGNVHIIKRVSVFR